VRSIRHPIILFVGVVIGVIGLGVLTLFATTHPKLYGPPWGRFTLSFPGRVYESRGFRTVSVPGDPQSLTPFSTPLSLRVPVFGYSTSSRSFIEVAPLSGVISPDMLDAAVVEAAIPGDLEDGSVAVSQKVSAIESALFGSGAHQAVQAENGFSVTTIGPECGHGQCKAAEVVTNGRAIWSLLAVSGGPPSEVAHFLASFEPVG